MGGSSSRRQARLGGARALLGFWFMTLRASMPLPCDAAPTCGCPPPSAPGSTSPAGCTTGTAPRTPAPTRCLAGLCRLPAQLARRGDAALGPTPLGSMRPPSRCMLVLGPPAEERHRLPHRVRHGQPDRVPEQGCAHLGRAQGGLPVGAGGVRAGCEPRRAAAGRGRLPSHACWLFPSPHC